MSQRTAGIDEAGRGPWAGPVIAAAVVLPHDTSHEWPNPTRGLALDDSKKLSSQARHHIYDSLQNIADIGIGQASVAEIDSLNILQATLLAMQRAVTALPVPPHAVLIDGNRAPALPMPTQTVVRGDASCSCIAAASIIAKVTRDRIMARLAVAYPGYGWERNAGYGVKEHHRALLSLGVTPHHRRSFRPVKALLEETPLPS